MKKLVLLRHGESTWNKENRFTGWTDVDLTPQGVQEAVEAGKTLKEAGFVFDKAYTSFLKRAVRTLNHVLEQTDLEWIPVEKSWRLNEKHYGVLQGLNKAETAEKFGAEQVLLWRRSFDVAPDALPLSDARHPSHELRYKNIPAEELPATESLKSCIARLMPYWEDIIWPGFKKASNLLVVAHGNSLRGIVKHLKNISDADIIGLNLPTGIPYVFEFDDDYNLVKDYFLGDAEKIKKLQADVANQAAKK